MPRSSPYLDVPEAPRDLDLRELVSPDRALELDVGFGRGHFILERARAHPELLMLGLETRRKWVGLVAARARRAGLDNVVVYFGDAREVLRSWGPAESLAAIYVNFPDPWWKKRHRKRRVVTAESIREFSRLLVPGGVLLVQTDVIDRGEDYRALLRAEPTLGEKLGDDGLPLGGNPTGTTSHRERKCEATGLPVVRIVMEKRGGRDLEATATRRPNPHGAPDDP